MVTAILVAATLSVSAVSAAGPIPDQQSGLAVCMPAWDPGDLRIVTWDGRSLHQEPYEIGDLCNCVWGDEDLEGGGTYAAGAGNTSVCTRRPRMMASASGPPW